VLVAFIDGFSIQKVGFDRIETGYFLILLSALLAWWLTSNMQLPWILYLIVMLACLWLGVLVTSPTATRLMDDTRYFMRSYLLGVMVFFYFQSLRLHANRLTKLYSMQWWLIAAFVLAHFFLGFGGVASKSGDLRPIYSSFFKEGNVIAFFFVVVWFYHYSRGYSWMRRMWLTAISFFVAGLLSSKAAILCMALLIFFHWLAYFKAASRLNAALANFAVLASLVALIVFFHELMDMFIWMLIYLFPDGAVILHRLSSWDVLTVLTSTRDLRVMELFNDMQAYSVGQILFGIGFNEVLASGKLIESDPFDILQAFGVAGILVFYFPVLSVLWIIKKDRVVRKVDFNYYVFALGTFYATIFVSTATGHILLTPMVMILFGIVFGYFMNIRQHARERKMV